MSGVIETLHALAFVLAINPQYPTPTEYEVDALEIRYAPRAQIQANYGNSTFAVYLRSGAIVRADECLDVPREPKVDKLCKSTLAHELTHWLDHINLGWPDTCTAMLNAERRGYRTQMRYEQRKFGSLVSNPRMPWLRC